MRRWATPLLATMLALVASAAIGQWKMVRKFVQPEVEIVEETKSFLILRHPEIKALVVLSLETGGEADIQGELEQERGGNPYRVWVATENFWNDPDRPKAIWGRFFRVEFLKILRPPSERDRG